MVVGAYFETNVVWRPVCTGVGTVDERTRARQTRKPWPKQNDGESLMCVSMPAIKVQTLTPSWAAMPCCADRRREVHLVRQLRLSADAFNGFGFNGADFLFGIVNTVLQLFVLTT